MTRKAQLKGVIVAVSLLCAGVLVSPSAQVSIQRGYNYAVDHFDILGAAGRVYRLIESGGNLLIQTSSGGAFSTVGTFTSGGQWLLTDGTVSLPALAFGSDPADGLYRTSNSMGWSINATLRGSLTANGVDVANDRGFAWSAIPGTSTPDLMLSRVAAASMRVGNSNTPTNYYDITVADWGTTLSAEGVSVPVDGLLYLGTAPFGTLEVQVGTDNRICRFELVGTSNATAEERDGGSLCSVTKDTATSINVYYDAAGASGAGYYIQNKRAGTRALRNVLIGS